MRRLLAPLAVTALFLASPHAGAPLQDGAKDALKKKTERHKKDVVRLRGLEFKKEVTVGLYTREELLDFLKRELAKELPPEKALHWQHAYAKFGLIPRDMDLMEAYMSLYGGAIAGFYHPETKELRLITPGDKDKDDNDALKAMGIDIEAVTLVHELTHAAQDQNYELSTLPLDDETNDDLIMALKGVIEGDASAVGWKYGFKGLFGMMMPRYNALLKKGELPGEAGQLPPYLRQTLTFAYGHGTDFVIKYLKVIDGDFKETDQLFKDFPLSTEQILHPEKYYEKGKRDNPTLVTFSGLSDIVGKPWKETLNNVHGEFATEIILREFLEGTPDEKRIRAGSEGWDGDRYVMLENGPKKVMYVWYTTWDSEDDAREFHRAYSIALEEKYGVPSPQERGDRRTFESREGHVFLQRKGQDVLVLDGADSGLLERTGRIWKAATKKELTGFERLKKFVCAACNVKEAFSGKCSTCGKALEFKSDDAPKKRGREYGVRRFRVK